MQKPNLESRVQLLESAVNTLIHRGDRIDARLATIEQRMQLLEDNQKLMLDYMKEHFEQIHQALARLETK